MILKDSYEGCAIPAGIAHFLEAPVDQSSASLPSCLDYLEFMRSRAGRRKFLVHLTRRGKGILEESVIWLKLQCNCQR